MRSVVLKSVCAGTAVLLAIAAVGCCHVAGKGKGKGKGMSCCGSGAACGPSKTAAPAAPQSQGQSVQQ